MNEMYFEQIFIVSTFYKVLNVLVLEFLSPQIGR